MTPTPPTDSELEFLIESNLIEGEDDNIKQPLLAWEYLKKQKRLTHNVICKAHKILMLDKPYPPPRGHYRSVPQIDVWIGRRHKPWSVVDALMENWLLDYENLGWKEAHIRFEHAHPFVDGNGRIGRLLMNWQRITLEELPILVINNYDKEDYHVWFRQ